MRILGDSNITLADITATNIISSALTDKLKTFTLTDNLRTIANTTRIDLIFNGEVPTVDCVGLCGSNLTSSSVITISYSDTDINSPDDSIVITDFSSLNQVLFLDAAISKKYWRINITDTSISTIFIGYLYIGKYFQVPAVEFGHTPSLNLFSNPSVTDTGQGYGSKIYNSLPLDFTMFMNYTELEEYFTILQEKQNIDPVLLIPYEESLALSLYRPRFGALINEENPYSMNNDIFEYGISSRLEERF